MSWYTAGEIVVWLLLAAILGGVLGWLLRGVLRPPRRRVRRSPVVIRDESDVVGTRVSEVDTGGSGATRRVVTDETRFAPPSARDRVAEVASRTAGGLTPPRDDLVRIHGVGPKIAELLVSAGITSFRQVARLRPEDIEVLDDALGGFSGRIDRDDWMSSARELHREVYGSEP
jgi:predicted flap endonuclease-1-like 5' DNA nuclease